MLIRRFIYVIACRWMSHVFLAGSYGYNQQQNINNIIQMRKGTVVSRISYVLLKLRDGDDISRAAVCIWIVFRDMAE